MNKQLQQIRENHSLERYEHMRVVSRFDRKERKWSFLGYICSKCEQTLRTEYLAKKHICQPAMARKCLREEITENIKTVSGKPFKQIVL